MALGTAFKDLTNSISLALIDTTRSTGQISNEDIAFHRSSNPSIVSRFEQQNSRLLGLAKGLISSAVSGTEVTEPHIFNADSIEDNWREIEDVVDNLLEKADACLDEYNGVIRKLSPSQEEQIRKAAPTSGKHKPAKAYRTQNIAKPQLSFNTVPSNDAASPFKPLLRTKPNALVTLDESLTLIAAEDGLNNYSHPYENEIKTAQYPLTTRKKAEPQPFLPFESSEAVFIDTPETLLSMLEELKVTTEIAVDVEHHDEHSYIGLVSLMQISTRDKDWIVDTLKPWREKLQVLNEVFTDPNILKVFHGSSMDMIWLQRDFGLYVVGLFDTFHASRLLGYPKHGLAYLLKRFANFDAAKQYQLADWRIRPLPEEMFNYARSDTHFLLYIYDSMRNELIDKSNSSQQDGDLIEIVMNRSKEETLQRYERPFYDTQRGSGPLGWYNMLCRTPALFNREQFAVFREVHQWRDRIAREEDESVHVIMPKHVLYNIAREMPVDMSTLLGCSHPISESLRNRKSELLAVTQNAKLRGHKGPDMKDFFVHHTIQPMAVDGFSKSNGTQNLVPVLATPKTAPLPHRPLAQRSDSLFWGSIIPSKMDGQVVDGILRESPCLALPVAQLAADRFETTKVADANADERSQTDSGVENRSTASEVFVVREAGAPRKRKGTDLYYSPNAVYSALQSNGTDNAQENTDEVDTAAITEEEERSDQNSRVLNKAKEEKRARRLESKRLKTEGLRGSEEKLREVEPFDYASAPSVLHAQRESLRMVMKREVNPYNKSSDTPKGLRRAKKEQGGQSFTFRG